MPRAAVQSGLPGSDPLGRKSFSNAALVAVNGPGAPDRNGDPGDGPLLWSGEALGYLTRIDSTTVQGGQQVAVLLDVFQIPVQAAVEIVETAGPDWEAATVTIEDRRIKSAPVTLTWRVNRMEHRAQNTILDHLRLELEHGVPA